jgi:tetratricopeptide (TPR) repeat protein
VTDLYHQIVERAISRPNSQTGLELYRGKKLSNTTLQQLSDNKNKLISINGFLSTTRNIAIAKSFADIGQTREGYESVVFKLCIDEGAVVRSPFTDISEDSVIENELEILFTMGSVWLLERMEWNDGYWMIELRSCNDLDSQLNQLRNLTNGYTFLSMGNILRELGQYANAKNFYRRMLDIGPSDKTTCGLVYYHMGLLADEQGEYMDALDYFLKVEELIPAATRLSINSEAANSRPIYAYNHPPSKLHIWNNIARSYEKKGDFGNARLYYKKGLDEKNDPSDQAVVYYNLGSFEYHQGNYEEARRYFIEAHRLGSDYKIIQGSQQKLKMIDALFQRGVELLK